MNVYASLLKSIAYVLQCSVVTYKKADTINDNDMLSYSLTAMMCFLTKE